MTSLLSSRYPQPNSTDLRRAHVGFNRLMLILAALAGTNLLFNMVALPLDAKAIFIDKHTFSAIEWVILVGFILVAGATLLSLVGLTRGLFSLKRPARLTLLVFGGLCLFFLAASKVMIDEISHEWQPGLGIPGEGMILYTLLGALLVYLLWVAEVAWSSLRGEDAPPNSA